MAHNNQEIEIKIPVNEQTFAKVKEKLIGIAKFVKITKQKDEYFTPVHRNFVEPEYPFEWLSIRERGNKYILNYKHFYPENVETATHCDELESEISNPQSLQKLLFALNIKNLVTVEKERETYLYNDEFEIALDKVNELGHFIEIETIKDFGSVELAREKLFNFAKSLDIDTSNPDKRGYPYLLLEKKSSLKKE